MALCFLRFASSVVVACGAAAQHSALSSVALPNPILNIHLTEASDAQQLHELAGHTANSEQLLGVLEKRAQATEIALGNHMSMIVSQINVLVNLVSSLAAGRRSGEAARQLRGRALEQQSAGIPAHADARHEIQSLKVQLDSVTQDAHSSDKDTRPIDEFHGGGFDTSGPEAVARQALMNAQKKFANAQNVFESDDQRAIDSQLALALGLPSHVGTPAPLHDRHAVVTPCMPDAYSCPKGWSNTDGVCVAGAGYGGPCASNLKLLGMSEEQLMVIARVCSLDLPCQ